MVSSAVGQQAAGGPNSPVYERQLSAKQHYVPDVATAQAIGEAVLRSQLGSDAFAKYGPYLTSFDSQQGVWQVHSKHPPLTGRGTETIGWGFVIKIRPENGEILGVFVQQ